MHENNHHGGKQTLGPGSKQPVLRYVVDRISAQMRKQGSRLDGGCIWSKRQANSLGYTLFLNMWIVKGKAPWTDPGGRTYAHIG